MKSLTTHYRTAVLLAALALAAGMPLLSPAFAADDDPVFRALSDELNRSMQRLEMKDVPLPYFLSYRVRDYDVINVAARYGAVVVSDQRRDRYLHVDLRVGSPELDNTNYYADWSNVWDNRADLPEENQYDALRHALWYRTDQAYKAAAEALAGKKAYLQTHPVKDTIPDFSKAEPVVSVTDPVRLSVDRAAWEKRLRESAAPLGEFPALQDWTIELNARGMNQWFVNSEGGRHLKGDLYYVLEVTAAAQAADGQRLTAFREYVAAEEADLPGVEELQEEIRGMAGDLAALAAAESLDEYVGPVLFTDFAAAQFVSQMIVEPMSPAREPLLSQEWMSQYFKPGKLAGRIKRRILPEFVTITDEPNRREWEGVTLAGYQPLDDEGVPGQDLTLVEKGRLITLPTNRQPLKKIPQSNGHARSGQLSRTVPGITNLVVAAEKPRPYDKLVADLRKLCRDQDLEYGLLVRQLNDERFSRRYSWMEPSNDVNDEMLSAPVVAYKVYAKDGRVEPVRGLKFDEVTVQTLRGVAALGRDVRAWNVAQANFFDEVRYPASIITPSILVEEMELKAASGYEPRPVADNPVFGK